MATFTGAAGFAAAAANVAALSRRHIAAAARSRNADVMRTSPRPLGFVRHVDGIEGAAEEAVQPGGVIVYDYDRLDLVLAAALDTLRELSPVAMGDYVRSHTVFLNSRAVDDVKAWRRGDEIAIANTMPYARKIERGRGGYRAHPHVYEQASRLLDRRFGSIAHIAFGYFVVESHADIAKVRSAGHAGAARRDDWLRRQPALFVSGA